jgi:transcriptional regulator of heat shock response
MQQRSADILYATVSEFIKTGAPVSSGILFERYDFGIRPAMIRSELNALAEQGFLEKSHHSAGRVPRDRGYEFFALRMLEGELGEQGMKEQAWETIRSGEWQGLARWISKELHMLGVCLDGASKEVHKEGLHELIERLDWSSREDITGVIDDFELIEKRMGRAFEDMENFLDIFIGKKSPVTTSPRLAVIAADIDMGSKRAVVVGVGPKRMDYRKAAATFKCMKQATNESKKK